MEGGVDIIDDKQSAKVIIRRFGYPTLNLLQRVKTARDWRNVVVYIPNCQYCGARAKLANAYEVFGKYYDQHYTSALTFLVAMPLLGVIQVLLIHTAFWPTEN